MPALLFTLAAWKDRSEILARAKDDGTKIVALFGEQAVHLFSGHETLLDLVVGHMRVYGWDAIPRELLDELEVIDNRLDGASEIVLVDAEGKTRATTLHLQPDETLPAPDRNCFLALSRGAVKNCISERHPDPVSGNNLFSLGRRLEKDGAFIGVAQVAISADYIVNLWAAATPSAADVITMFRADGTILAQSKPQSKPELALPGIGRFEAGIAATVSFFDAGNGILVQQKLADYPIDIDLRLDKSAILATWHSNIAVYGVVAASATAGMMLALGIAIRQAQKEHRAIGLWRGEIQERESAQEQLRQSQKMESLGQLTGGIAHDFNNLLTVIIGNVSMVHKRARDTDDRRLLQNALKAGASAVTLTQRLLVFARKQVLQPKPVDLLDLLDGMRSLLARTLGPDVRLTVFSDSQLWSAQVDPNQIELLILNLAINARDAMPTGGTLSITASNGEPGPGAPLDLAPGQYVVLTVGDTGTGMDEATLARATEPFFTTKEAGKGTGLGLSMMQGVVSQSGGATRLRSKPGRGTTVELWLPRAKTAPIEIREQVRHRELQGGGPILVCDDNSTVLEFVCDALTSKGYQALRATTGRAALSMLGGDDTIRLLIVDFLMPEMNGAAVAREVRTRRPFLPILLITGNADPDAIQADLPDVPVMRKPFDQDQLATRVAELLES